MELERVVIGLVTAALLPYSVPAVRPRRLTALALTAGYALYTLAPGLLSWAALLLLPLCLGASWLLGRLAKADANMQGSPRLFRPAGTARFIFVPLGLAVLLALASGLLYGGPLLTRATGDLSWTTVRRSWSRVSSWPPSSGGRSSLTRSTRSTPN